MSRTEGESSQSENPAAPSTSGSRVRTRSDPFLIGCRFFSFITSLASILCIVVNVFSAVRSFKNGSDLFDGIFRCYAVVIAIFVVVAETEWELVTRFSKVLEYWAGRGMLQILRSSASRVLVFSRRALTGLRKTDVAVMTKAYPETSTERKDLLILQNVASYMLLACGVVYVISGVLCIGHLKRARQKKEVTADQAIKDLQDLERRREELEALLIADGVV